MISSSWDIERKETKKKQNCSREIVNEKNKKS